jgi:aspartate kinase
VTHTTELVHFSIAAGAGDAPPYTRTFRALGDVGINVDMISVSPAACSFVVDAPRSTEATDALRRVGVKPTVRPCCAKVVVVGRLMRYAPGVMAQVSEALVTAGVEVIQTSDSLNTISCLIDADDLQAAVRALHHRFRLEETDHIQGGVTK